MGSKVRKVGVLVAAVALMAISAPSAYSEECSNNNCVFEDDVIVVDGGTGSPDGGTK